MVYFGDSHGVDVRKDVGHGNLSLPIGVVDERVEKVKGGGEAQTLLLVQDFDVAVWRSGKDLVLNVWQKVKILQKFVFGDFAASTFHFGEIGQEDPIPHFYSLQHY